MKPNMNCINDVMSFLDDIVPSVDFNDLYSTRRFVTTFTKQNTLPDENLIAFLKEHKIESAVDIGCGEGRNTIYLAKNGVKATGYDIAEKGIENAKILAEKAGVDAKFVCKNIFDVSVTEKVDLVFDTGLLHHLAPHRRITYLDYLRKALKPGGYLIINCFRWCKENSAAKVDDWQFYKQRFNGGNSFTKERLTELFSPYFNIIEIRDYQDGIKGAIQGFQYVWACLFKLKNNASVSV